MSLDTMPICEPYFNFEDVRSFSHNCAKREAVLVNITAGNNECLKPSQFDVHVLLFNGCQNVVSPIKLIQILNSNPDNKMLIEYQDVSQIRDSVTEVSVLPQKDREILKC